MFKNPTLPPFFKGRSSPLEKGDLGGLKNGAFRTVFYFE